MKKAFYILIYFISVAAGWSTANPFEDNVSITVKSLSSEKFALGYAPSRPHSGVGYCSLIPCTHLKEEAIEFKKNNKTPIVVYKDDVQAYMQSKDELGTHWEGGYNPSLTNETGEMAHFVGTAQTFPTELFHKVMMQVEFPYYFCRVLDSNQNLLKAVIVHYRTKKEIQFHNQKTFGLIKQENGEIIFKHFLQEAPIKWEGNQIADELRKPDFTDFNVPESLITAFLKTFTSFNI